MNAEAVLSRVSVEPVRASHLVDVSFVSAAPDLASETINTLAEEYVAQNLDLRRQNMERSLSWLADELARQKRLVESSERAMAQYREDQNALSLEDRQNIVIARLNQLNEAATRARTNRAQKESLYRRLEVAWPLGISGHDSRDSAERLHSDDESADRGARAPQSAVVRTIR